MNYSRILAVAFALAAISLSGIPAQGQQEVDPTSYPLVRTVQYSPQRTTSPRIAKQGSGRRAQQGSTKKTTKASTDVATPHGTAKTVAKR